MGFDLACPGMTWMMAVWFGLALLAGVYSEGEECKQTNETCVWTLWICAKPMGFGITVHKG